MPREEPCRALLCLWAPGASTAAQASTLSPHMPLSLGTLQGPTTEPGWPRTQATSPASTSWVLQSRVGTTMPSPYIFYDFFLCRPGDETWSCTGKAKATLPVSGAQAALTSPQALTRPLAVPSSLLLSLLGALLPPPCAPPCVPPLSHIAAAAVPAWQRC